MARCDSCGLPLVGSALGTLREIVGLPDALGAHPCECAHPEMRVLPDGVDPTRNHESFGFHVRAFFAFQEPGGGAIEFSEFVDHENRRMASRAAWNRYFADAADAFLCPVNFTAAFPHDLRPFEERAIATPQGERSYNDQAFWVSHASLAGLPAVAAPIGRTPGGLPVGAQVVGPLYEDDTAITFAELVSDVIGGYEPPRL